MRSLKVAGLILGAFLVMALPARAHGLFRGRAIVVRPAFGFWGGGYDPFFYGPYGWYGPYGVYPAYYSNVGELKLKTNVKDADVYVDGAFAGKASKLKSMRLRPKAYDLEIRASGYAPFSERIYVTAGKTLKLTVDLIPARRS